MRATPPPVAERKRAGASGSGSAIDGTMLSPGPGDPPFSDLRQPYRRRRRNRRKKSVRSNNHRLLGEDTRHRALRRCLGDRGQERRGEVASGVDAGEAGLAALVDFEDDASGRIDRL